MIADGVTGLLMHSLASPAAMLALQKAADAVVFEEGKIHGHGHGHGHGHHLPKSKGKHLMGDAGAESSEEDEDISEVAKKLKTEGSAKPTATHTKMPSQTSILRLRKVQEGLRSTNYFDTVELNNDRTQLIVRKDDADAYCRIEWGIQQKHQVSKDLKQV